MKARGSPVAVLVAALAVGGPAQTLAPPAHAAPAPEVEYVYNVMVRRHYSFPDNDALGYGHGICDKVTTGNSYAQIMSDAKRDVSPNDEFAANYLVSYAVNLLCPAEIWQLRNSAAQYQPPVGPQRSQGSISSYSPAISHRFHLQRRVCDGHRESRSPAQREKAQ